MTDTRADLVAKISKAATFAQQASLVRELDDYDQNLRSQAAWDRELDLAGAVVEQTLTPVRTHEFHTAATDWIADFEPEADPTAHHASIAEAALWFGRVSPEVKADVEEFGIQAEGFMRREASKHGEQADAVYSEGLSYLGFLYRRHGASGLDQIQQTVNPHEDNAPTPLPPDVFDNFAPDVDPINAGVVGTETSERAPLLQEIMGEGNGQGQPEKPIEHDVGDDVSFPDQPADASAGPVAMDSEEGGAEQMAGAEQGPPQGQQAPQGPPDDEEEQDPDQKPGIGAQGSWEARSVAISHTMNLDDFRALQAREAASGLDQIQQTSDPHDNPDRNTPLPTQVMFPWLISPNQSNEGDEDQDVPPSGAADVANSPNPYQGGRKQGGNYDPTDDPSSWQHDKSAHPGGPSKGTPDDLFPNGVPIHGDLTEEQQAWLDRGRKKGTHKTSVALQHEDLPPGETFHGTTKDLQPGDYLQASVHGYSLVKSVNGSHIQFDHGGSESGYPYRRAIHRPHDAKESSRKTADMYGNSDMPHQVPGPSPANTPATTPQAGAGYEQGYQDAQQGARPTYADASSSAPPNVVQYTKGFQDGSAQRSSSPSHDDPGSLGAAASRISDRFVKQGARQDPEFRKGYGFATKWAPGKPLVSLGSGEFEAGVFAGLMDRPKHQEAWVAAHRRQARKDQRFATRMQTYSRYMDHLAEVGISVEATSEDTLNDIQRRDPDGQSKKPTATDYKRHKDWTVGTHGQQAWDDYHDPAGWGHQPGDEPEHVEARRRTAATSTDLDTMDPSASPSQSGQTPINGQGQPGPLAGGQDPAAPGGPSPYNGADPLGHPVVPTGQTAGGGGNNYVNDIPGGPADGNVNPAAIAFRRQVQASLLQQTKRG